MSRANYKIWYLNREMMTLSSTLYTSESRMILDPEIGHTKRIILVFYGQGVPQWVMHTPNSLKGSLDYFDSNITGHVWIGKLVVGQEVVQLTRICEKDIKKLIIES